MKLTKKIIAALKSFTSTDKTRPHIAQLNIYVDKNNEHSRLIATDGHVLVEFKTPDVSIVASRKANDVRGTSISSAALNELKRVMTNNDQLTILKDIERMKDDHAITIERYVLSNRDAVRRKTNVRKHIVEITHKSDDYNDDRALKSTSIDNVYPKDHAYAFTVGADVLSRVVELARTFGHEKRIQISITGNPSKGVVFDIPMIDDDFTIHGVMMPMYDTDMIDADRRDSQLWVNANPTANSIPELAGDERK